MTSKVTRDSVSHLEMFANVMISSTGSWLESDWTGEDGDAS